MNKKFWMVVVLLTLALAGAVAFKTIEKARREAETKNKGASDAIPVEAVTPVRLDLADRRIFSGSLKAWSVYDVAPKVSGRLEMLKVNIGDPVRHGQVIAGIDDIEYRQQLDQAVADLEVARAQEAEARAILDLRKKEFARQEQLDRNGIGSKAQLEAAQSAWLSQQASHLMTQAEIKRRTATLENTRLKLDYATIAADWSENKDSVRFVGNRYVDEGSLLQVNQPIISIAEIDRLRAAIHVIERDYPYLHEGQTAEITTDAYPDRIFYGKVSKISQVLQENSRQAYVLLEIPNADLKLKPGMFVRVHLEFACRSGSLAVPQSAIRKRDGKSGVFVLSEDASAVDFIEVETGITVGGRVEILAPEITRPVVTLGNHLLSSGVKVLPVSIDGMLTGGQEERNGKI